MTTCVIVGQNHPDMALERLVAIHDRVIVFEPLPEAAAACRYAYKDCPELIVFQAACGDYFETQTLNVYNRNGLSSSLGSMTADAVEVYGSRYDLSLQSTEQVNVVHLGTMLQMLGVVFIDNLIIDAQGMDFTILKTVEPLVCLSRIKRVQMEADGSGFRHYEGLPDNSEMSILDWMKSYPQYEASRLSERLKEQPDLVFELVH